jgi:hypothetical protein
VMIQHPSRPVSVMSLQIPVRSISFVARAFGEARSIFCTGLTGPSGRQDLLVGEITSVGGATFVEALGA